MSISRFFCENLLSDYHEGLLPVSRKQEVEAMVSDGGECESTYRSLKSAISILGNIQLRQVPPEVALQVMDICEGKGRSRNSERRKKWVLATGLVGSAIFLIFLSIPAIRHQIPLLSNAEADKASFVRYYPLYQGAQEILEEQAAWIEQRDSLAGNFWEEGGLTPSEFERSFQIGARVVEKSP